MRKIIPHLWFNTEAQEAAHLYTSLFPDSHINTTTVIPDTPSGNAEIVTYTLAGEEYMAISAGPYFTFNPLISLFVACSTEEEIETLWNKLREGGEIRMGYQEYPWATRYAWLDDKYGLSWQLSWSEGDAPKAKLSPLLLFNGPVAGKAREAIEFYTSIFPRSSVDMLTRYEKGEGNDETFLKHARFTLMDTSFMAMDSSFDHGFNFNEAISFVVNCDTQDEIDRYWAKLSAVPEAEQCGWLKDTYGVSWQIVPSIMNEMMTTGTKDQINRVTEAFLKMKKFDIAALQAAFAE